MKIRVETISYYLDRYSPEIIARKLAQAAPGCPLAGAAARDEISLAG